MRVLLRGVQHKDLILTYNYIYSKNYDYLSLFFNFSLSFVAISLSLIVDACDHVTHRRVIAAAISATLVYLISGKNISAADTVHIIAA